MSKFSSEASGHPDLEMHESTQSIEELSNKCVELWNIKLEQGILVGVHFKDFWRKHVPKIYSPEPNQSCLDWNFQETRVQEIVINHNRVFIKIKYINFTSVKTKQKKECVIYLIYTISHKSEFNLY